MLGQMQSLALPPKIKVDISSNLPSNGFTINSKFMLSHLKFDQLLIYHFRCLQLQFDDIDGLLYAHVLTFYHIHLNCILFLTNQDIFGTLLNWLLDTSSIEDSNCVFIFLIFAQILHVTERSLDISGILSNMQFSHLQF